MMRKMLDPSYLPTISMSELYENIYEKKPPIIDGLLYSGMEFIKSMNLLQKLQEFLKPKARGFKH